jgi:hypothetical protein
VKNVGQSGSKDAMTEIHIQQVYYSAQTRDARDPGFVGLDNMDNPRPDWREYWPIRRFLLHAPMNDAGWYGFFSPKFSAKTGLDSGAVLKFVRAHASDSDVILFSPFFDQIAYPLNIFEQGAMQHPDTLVTFRECALLASPGIDFEALVMDSTNTVFCNYFVAKPAFWREWLAKCELLFGLAEAGTSDLAKRLNASTSHDGGGVPTKVFVIERIASLMLATEKRWKAKAYNAMSLPWSNAPTAKFQLEMAFLDALKIAYASQGHPQYLNAFHSLRQVVSQWMAPPK